MVKPSQKRSQANLTGAKAFPAWPSLSVVQVQRALPHPAVLYWDAENMRPKVNSHLKHLQNYMVLSCGSGTGLHEREKWDEEWADEFAWYAWYRANVCSYLVGPRAASDLRVKVQVYGTYFTSLLFLYCITLFAVAFAVLHAVPCVVLFTHVFVIDVLPLNSKPYFLSLYIVLRLLFSCIAEVCRRLNKQMHTQYILLFLYYIIYIW